MQNRSFVHRPFLVCLLLIHLVSSLPSFVVLYFLLLFSSSTLIVPFILVTPSSSSQWFYFFSTLDFLSNLVSAISGLPLSCFLCQSVICYPYGMALPSPFLTFNSY